MTGVRPEPLVVTTVAELRDAYQNGWLTTDHPVMLDNDDTSVYDDSGEVFRMHPYTMLEQALTLLGIPNEGV